MKKGISLIVLVITIIVIIILAGAVILSLANNNPIAQANQATRESDADAVQSALSMYLGRIMAEFKAPVKLPGTAGTYTAINGVAVLDSNNNPVYTNGTAYQSFATPAAATAAGYTTAVTLTPSALGFASWPTYSGYALRVDANGDVKFE